MGVVGALIVALGIVAIPLPGPGWLIVIAGLFVLATEFLWAERLLEFTKKHLKRWTDWVADQPVWVRRADRHRDGGLRLRRRRGHAAHDRGPDLGAGVGARSGAEALAQSELQQRRAIGSVVERFVHTEEVTGSNPVSPTRTEPQVGPERDRPGVLS